MFDLIKSKAKQAIVGNDKGNGNDNDQDQTKDQAGLVNNAVAAAAAAIKSSASQSDGKYTVKPGDSLTNIADAHNLPRKQVLAANPQIKNKDLIHPGDVINLG